MRVFFFNVGKGNIKTKSQIRDREGEKKSSKIYDRTKMKFVIKSIEDEGYGIDVIVENDYK